MKITESAISDQLFHELYDEGNLPRECLLYSEKHLGETKTKREEKLRELMVWVERISHLKLDRNNIIWMLYFLRATKFRTEKAKNKMKRFVLYIFG